MALLDNRTGIFVGEILHRDFLLELTGEYLVGRAVERHVAGKKLIEHYAYCIEVGGFVLVGHIAYDEFGRCIGGFSHELACGCEMLVGRSERVEFLADSEIDELDLSVGSDHHIARVDVTVDISGIMESHNTRKDVAGDEQGETHAVAAVLAVKFLGKFHLLAVGVGGLAAHEVVEHHAVEQLARHVIAFVDIARRVNRVDFDEAEHLNEVFVVDFHRSLPAGALDSALGKIVEKEFDSSFAADAVGIIDPYAAKHLPHASSSNRRQRGIHFIMDAELFLFRTLNSYYSHFEVFRKIL